MTQRFSTDQLDSSTRAYLRTVVSAGGRRMPGIYHASSNSMPVLGVIFGLAILLATVLITFPPTEEPTKEAFLQTAGFLLGGWMVTAAIRVWIARSSGKSFGTFIYADSQHLYEVAGNQVDVTELDDIVEAKANQLQGDNGYTGTDISVVLGNGLRKISINSQITGKRMTVFLNALAYIRQGGEDGSDEQLKALNVYDRAAYARHIAYTGEFPRSVTAVEEIETMDIPSAVLGVGSSGSQSGMLGYISILVAAVLLFVSFRVYNKAVREDTIYARILELNEKERPPALRMYLSHPEFNHHRADATSRLEAAYARAADTMIKGSNEEFRTALRELVISLAKKPQPVISLSVEDESPVAGANLELKNSISTELADKWGSTVGDELITFVKPENPEINCMIHLAFKRQGQVIDYTFTFRKGPDDPVYQTIKGTFKDPLGFNIAQSFASHVMSESCGLTRIRQMPIDQDF